MTSSETETMDPVAEPSLRSTDSRLLRLAIGLELCGLVAAVPPMVDLTPGTFMIFATVSTPLLLAGMGCFVLHVFGVLRRRGAL